MGWLLAVPSRGFGILKTFLDQASGRGRFKKLSFASCTSFALEYLVNGHTFPLYASPNRQWLSAILPKWTAMRPISFLLVGTAIELCGHTLQ